jgi:hypothetical protein
MIANVQKHYLTDTSGKKIAVILDIDTYHQLIEQINELYCLKKYPYAAIQTELEIANDNFISLKDCLANNDREDLQ